jgi:hypothetical protein
MTFRSDKDKKAAQQSGTKKSVFSLKDLMVGPADPVPMVYRLQFFTFQRKRVVRG